jgi:quinol monooxygenase YgiN
MDSNNRLTLATCTIDMRFDSEKLDHAVRLLLSVQGDILRKNGCHDCNVGKDATEAGLVHYREEWESMDAFTRHVQSEEFRRVLIAMDLCCEEPRVVVADLSGQIGMEYLRKLREEGDKILIDLP